MTSLGTEPSLKPIGDISVPAGYAAPALMQSKGKTEDLAKISKVAGKVLQDPLLMRLLSDRVYKLMLEDLRRQQERSRNYGGFL
ncbi:hypothetical protein H6F96_03200 [Microcoleus sp. FACHB-53]|nr:hypothetical protein [Microcoleus sp. FACHB-53]